MFQIGYLFVRPIKLARCN